MAAIAKVEPLTRARALRGPFDYKLAGDMDGVGVGTILRVPFGRRRIIGVVVGTADVSELPAERLVAPLSVLEPGIPAELVDLGLWVAAEYCSTPARGLGLVLPPGTGPGGSSRQRIGPRVVREVDLTAGGLRAVGGEVSPKVSAVKNDASAVHDAGSPRQGGSGEGCLDGAPRLGDEDAMWRRGGGEDRSGEGLSQRDRECGARLGARQQAVLEALVAGALPVADVCRRAGASHQTVRSLERRGLVTLTEVAVRRRPAVRSVGDPTKHVQLTESQRAALSEIVAAIDDCGVSTKDVEESKESARGPEGSASELKSFLLHGVTGSGKTEVYLAAVARTLELGRSAVVLVPEIALTPQTLTRFRERFGDRVAVLHSALSDGERYDEWVRLRRGEARVCVGPRSAVFAPVKDIGLIVVDEEHDSSYKQEQDPRYDARAVARRRAAGAGAVLLAGSATPSVESYANLPRLSLPSRVDGRRLPPVEVLDMRNKKGVLHPAAHAALHEVRRHGEKAVVMINRRGWSAFISCRSCGRVWRCPGCDVSLTLHRGSRRLVCHHCGHTASVPRMCPDCDSVSVARHGTGAERLEAELKRALSGMPVYRLDSDSARGKHAAQDILASFQRASRGVLVGTQMVAKGHDFSEITLGVVLDADAGLRMPDFRAEERTFSLITQLAGRAGRGAGGGRVLVQTLAPGASSIRLAAAHDAHGFMAVELGRREELGYPPFGSLIKAVCSSPDEGLAEEAAGKLACCVGRSSIDVLGPASLFRLQGRYRFQVLIKVGNGRRAEAVSAVREAVEEAAGRYSRRGVRFAVDVDPQS